MPLFVRARLSGRKMCSYDCVRRCGNPTIWVGTPDALYLDVVAHPAT